MNHCECDDKVQPARPAPAAHRVYGRGLYDGLRMAGITDPEAFMNEAKLNRMSEGLTTIAKRVLEAVPISEPWHKNVILAELRRTGSMATVDVMEGCLASLKDKGLIVEAPAHAFRRLAAKPKMTLVLDVTTAGPPPPEPEPVPAAQPEPALPADPLAALAVLASALTKLSVEIGCIANQIEITALNSAELLQGARADGEKLRQLQNLLRSIGAGAAKQ
jgi:hypothetical protein